MLGLGRLVMACKAQVLAYRQTAASSPSIPRNHPGSRQEPRPFVALPDAGGDGTGLHPCRRRSAGPGGEALPRHGLSRKTKPIGGGPDQAQVPSPKGVTAKLLEVGYVKDKANSCRSQPMGEASEECRRTREAKRGGFSFIHPPPAATLGVFVHPSVFRGLELIK